MYQDIVYEVADPVATVRLNRPERLNAFTYRTLEEFRDAIGRAAADPAVVGIVVTGEGRGFCAGLDVEALEATARAPAGRVSAADPEAVPGLFSYLLAVGKPLIAAVNGVAAGGGFVLAAMCDLRFASRAASFTTVFSRRGLIAEHGTSWILPRLLGPGRALDLLWSSRRVDAEEAARIGLVEFLTEPAELVARVRSYVEELAKSVSPSSMRDTKRLVYRHLGVGHVEALREADAIQQQSFERADPLEGVRSFVERRPPKFPRLGGPS